MDRQIRDESPELDVPNPEDFGFGQLYRDIPDAVIVGNVETGLIELWNPAAEALFGLSTDEAIGQPIGILIPEPLRQQHCSGLAHYQHTGGGELIDSGLPVELPALRRKVEPITIELRLLPVTSSQIPGRFVMAIIRDATQRKEAERDRLRLASEHAARVAAEQAAEALRQSEERFRTAFDHAPIGMDLVDLDGRFLQVNAALCELMGYTEQELLALTFQEITLPEDREADLALVNRLLAGEIPAYRMEKRYVRKDGQVIWALVNSSLVRDQQGLPLYFIGQIEDITARVWAEQELRAALDDAQAANRAKGAFLNMMSHELRTPLQATLGYSEFLLSAPEGALTAEQRQDIGYIHQASQRMIAMVNQLLDLSRSDAGHLNLAVEPVDLAEVLEHVRQDVAPQVAQKAIGLEIEVPASLPYVLGDAERVRQILLNLVSNAVKFTHAGHVRVTATRTTTGVVEIVVSDTGEGISAAALPHIFDEFSQGDSRLSRRFGGTGLGLAISRKLVEQMGGRIDVSSEPGVGSTFRVYLPMYQS
ncbi:MAG: PAS domain-containing sensor histidine kinase [Thermomicrobiales bacterium]